MIKGHTSVIYFHGIGDPQRHVSLSNFLDYFDLFGQAQSSRGIGRPRQFRHRTELNQAGDVVNYVEFQRIRQIGGKPIPTKVVRVYEAYWVPEAATKFSSAYLIAWILLRFWNPVRLAFSKWRSYPSLKLSYLYEIDEDTPSLKVHQKLERLYRDFEN